MTTTRKKGLVKFASILVVLGMMFNMTNYQSGVVYAEGGKTQISFESATYRDETVGFEFDYPAAWIASDLVALEGGETQVQFAAADGMTMSLIVHRWEPVNDLDAYIRYRTEAWLAGGMTILSQDPMTLAGDHFGGRFMVQTTASEQTFFFFTSFGDRYLEMNSLGDSAVLTEIASTVRAIETTILPTDTPVVPTETPVAPTEPPIVPTETPVAPTEPSVAPTNAPVQPIWVQTSTTPTVPTPVAPSGTISDTTPTFTWTRISGATNYYLAVYQGTTLKYVKGLGSSACGTSTTTCSTTPTNVLTADAYTWKVMAYVGGAWKPFCALKPFTVTNVPTPIAPSGTVSDTTPTFTWTRISGATNYYLAVYQGATLKYVKGLGSSACGASTTTCSTTPTNVLTAGAHSWKVMAYVGGAWKPFSALKPFTVVISTAFNDLFTSSSSGWTPVNGAWSVGSGSYQTLGLPGLTTSTAHSNSYSTFTYEVSMYRTGCVTCVNSIYFRGSPNPVTSNPSNSWNNGYRFSVSQDQYYQILYSLNGTYHTIRDWTYLPSVVTSGWNTLKVTANGTYLQFFINGTMVAYRNLGYFSIGQVGIGFYRPASSTGDHLYVDRATLSLSAPSSIVSTDGIDGPESPLNVNAAGNSNVYP